jgi:uncharacterized membrane protein YidH (DUF202 family)
VSTGPASAQPRTSLAWQRTGLGLLGLAAVLLKTGVSRDVPLEVVAAGLALLTSAAVLALLPRVVGTDPRRRSLALSALTGAVLIVEVLAVAGAFVD